MKSYTVYSFFCYGCTGVQTNVGKIITNYVVEIIHVLLITDINYTAFIKFSSVTPHECYDRTLTYTINESYKILSS